MTRRRLAFMGTPEFAVPALRAVHDIGHDIVAVYTQPARMAGRGQAMRASAVETEAIRLGLPVRTPERLRGNDEAQAEFAALGLDIAVVAAYGLILPAAMLRAPVFGCLNIHASLLPRWRGASPIQAAILAGDTQSGVTIMQMETGLDTGPILLSGCVPITDTTTAKGLHDALAPLGARLVVEALEHLPVPTPQPEAGVTLAPRLSRIDGRLDWSEPSLQLDRRIRAMHPWPGATALLDGQPLKIISARPEGASTRTAVPGTILDDQFLVATGTGALRITRLQLPGRAVLEAEAFLRGHPLPAGTRLG